MGVLQVNFSAGEPLLRDDIVELVRHAHDAGLITRINTNGLLLDRNRVSELKKAGLTQCGVSIDDADPETHDELRGVPGAHAKALEGIRNLRESGILCQTLTCVTRRNLASGLEKIVELGKQLGVMSVYFFFPVAVGRWDCDYDQVLTEAERAKVRELRDMTFVHLELPTFRSKCILITKEILFVSPMGDVTPCPFVPYAMGNVKKHALSHMWQRYCAGLNVDYEGECPMNDPQCRDTIERHIENTRL